MENSRMHLQEILFGTANKQECFQKSFKAF